MIERIRRSASPGPEIVGRKYAADKRNDRQPVLTVIADGIDIPPGVSIVFYVLVKNGNHGALVLLVHADLSRPKSMAAASAASRPEIATMGIPAPG